MLFQYIIFIWVSGLTSTTKLPRVVRFVLRKYLKTEIFIIPLHVNESGSLILIWLIFSLKTTSPNTEVKHKFLVTQFEVDFYSTCDSLNIGNHFMLWEYATRFQIGHYKQQYRQLLIGKFPFNTFCSHLCKIVTHTLWAKMIRKLTQPSKHFSQLLLY